MFWKKQIQMKLFSISYFPEFLIWWKCQYCVWIRISKGRGENLSTIKFPSILTSLSNEAQFSPLKCSLMKINNSCPLAIFSRPLCIHKCLLHFCSKTKALQAFHVYMKAYCCSKHPVVVQTHIPSFTTNKELTLHCLCAQHSQYKTQLKPLHCHFSSLTSEGIQAGLGKMF